jgi:selenium metabolism protein YedF
MQQAAQTRPGSPEGIVVFIRANSIGRGDDELGLNLMMNFLHQLSKIGPAPGAIILMNSGVKLAVEGSEFLDELKELEGKGVRILACGTCLDFFKIKEKRKVGAVSNMVEITKTLLDASKVISI